MKKLFFAAIMLLALSVNNSSTYAQSVIRNGKTFESVNSSSRTSRDTLKTEFMWKDSKGVTYPIIVNKKSGACYIWRKSSKSAKMYRSYLGEELSRQVCKELGITYVPKTKKN